MRDSLAAVGRREKRGYFKRPEGAPGPLAVEARKRVALQEADVLGIAWHGRYAEYFELAAAELRRRCGFSFEELREAGLTAPIVQFHVDHYLPLALDEAFSVTATLTWSEGARLNIEYEVRKSDGRLAATGYTIQMFVDPAAGEPLLISPEILERCRRRWLAGEFGETRGGQAGKDDGDRRGEAF